MKPFKLLGLAIVAACALIASEASTAGAISLDALPGTIANPVLFKFENTTAEKVDFESVGGHLIACGAVKGSGELHEGLGAIEFKFTGCLEPSIGIKCTGLGNAEGEIAFKAEQVYLRHLLSTEGKPLEVSMLVRMGVVHFSCAIVLFILEGCATSMDLLTEPKGAGILGKLRESFFANYLQEKGVPKPLSIDTIGSTGMEECTLFVKEGEKAVERAALLAPLKLSKFTQNGFAVTVLVDLLLP